MHKNGVFILLCFKIKIRGIITKILFSVAAFPRQIRRSKPGPDHSYGMDTTVAESQFQPRVVVAIPPVETSHRPEEVSSEEDVPDTASQVCVFDSVS